MAEIHLKEEGEWAAHTPLSLKRKLDGEPDAGGPIKSEALIMLLGMALCNSCETDGNDNETNGNRVHSYKYTSADDMAFVECAADVGFVLSHSTASTKRIVDASGTRLDFAVVRRLAFSLQCIDMCMGMCADMCMDMCADMCMDMCTGAVPCVLAADKTDDHRRGRCRRQGVGANERRAGEHTRMPRRR